MTGRRLVVTVRSPSGSHAVSLPAGAAVADLMPGLVKACEGRGEAAGWRLAPQGEPALSDSMSLEQAGLFQGAVLVLTAPDQAAQTAPVAEPEPAEPRIASMGAAEYRRTLDRALAAAVTGSSKVIGVIGAHPGAGATTVTALLAILLSTVGDERIAAVDANPESGELGHWLVPDSALPADVYRGLFDGGVTPPDIERALVAAYPRLWVLPAPLGSPAGRSVEASAWTRLIEHLRHLHNVVVVDCGAGMRKERARAALASADQVVVVSRPGPAGLENLGRTIEDFGGAGRPVVMVANRATRRTRMRRTEGGVPLVTLALEPSAAVTLTRRGFVWSQAPDSWQEAIRELAAVLVASG
jgi:MinD-like ATPase involved in chromosome partitioning or flagellar assembly